MVSSEIARDLVQRGARVRVLANAIGIENHVMAEGQVIGYCAAPTLVLRHEDGSQSHWSCDLFVEEVLSPEQKIIRAATAWRRHVAAEHQRTNSDERLFSDEHEAALIEAIDAMTREG